MERACILADGEFVTELELAGTLRELGEPQLAAAPYELTMMGGSASASGGESLADVERDHIMRALQRAGGNKKAAARILGVSRRALYRRLERLELGDTISRRPARATETKSAA
jgi:DNA-binding NtrC family response regulator